MAMSGHEHSLLYARVKIEANWSVENVNRKRVVMTDSTRTFVAAPVPFGPQWVKD